MNRNSGNCCGETAPVLPKALVLAIVTTFGVVGQAGAFEFSSKDGELTGSFDTTLSVGALWRMQGRDASLISIANGGSSRDPNGDDGNLNYDRGDLVSSAIKATHDLELSYRNFGAFVRASYFYDGAVMDKRALLKNEWVRLHAD